MIGCDAEPRLTMRHLQGHTKEGQSPVFPVAGRDTHGYCDNKHDGLNFIKIPRKILQNGS